MNTNERKNRIIARGEHSNHSHVIVGDAEVTRNKKGEIIIEVGAEGAMLRHILETDWLDGREVWTEEHKDIDLSSLPGIVRHGDVVLEKVGERSYAYIQQKVYDPLTKRIEDARD